MPIYEYGCPSCEHHFEEIQKISDGPITVCPECEKDGVRRLVSAPSFHLKGSGWYKDHYGLKSGGAAAKTSETAASTTNESGATSSDSSSKSDAGTSSGD
jgi:putative FmdB family regulatory protein